MTEKKRRPPAKRCHRLAPALAIPLFACMTACAPSHTPALQADSIAPAAPAPVAMPSPQPVAAPFAPAVVAAGPAEFGTASWYRPGPGLHRTCTGETFTRNEMTAASPTLPMGTRVRVALRDDGRSIVVRVNDCMPHGHRILDLSEGAAEQLGLVNLGIARVTVTPVMLVDNR